VRINLTFSAYIMEKGFISDILRSTKTVFSFKDLILFWGNIEAETARARLSYYTRNGGLYPIRRGLYAKDKNYDKLELATKIFTPSYVSFETVLSEAGVVFQHYSQIFVASYQTKDITCDSQIYSFKRLKENILTNNAGIENRGNYSAASKERAFLDILYLNKEYHFDNLSPLDWDKVFAMIPIYDNKRMIREVNKYFKEFKKDNI